MRDAAPAELWRYTSDLLFLVDNPFVRDAFFPTGETPFALERALPGDEAAILSITARHQGPRGAAIVAAWWQAVPEAFRVARDRAGEVAAFLLLAEPRSVGARVIDRDPVATRWREDLHGRSLPHDRRVLFVRFLLDRDAGEAPGAAQGALWLDAKRLHMELRPHLRRVYAVTARVDVFGPLLTPLGFTPLPGPPVVIDGIDHHSRVLDFGPRSVDGWLAWLVAAELGADAGPRPDRDRRELALGGRVIALTQLEVDLLAYLHARGGDAVPRAELLREVWGYQWQGGGNVIEVAVSGLRRKLGDDASLVETVRGVGYRWGEG